jgi:hypothetical protein
MRPFLYLRASRALVAAGVPATALAFAALPAMAKNNVVTTTHAVAPASSQKVAPVAHAARARVVIHTRRLNVVSGRHTTVSGRLVGRGRGHIVVFQRAAAHGRWVTIDRDATNRTGRFRLSSRVSRIGTSWCASASAATRSTAPRRGASGA